MQSRRILRRLFFKEDLSMNMTNSGIALALLSLCFAATNASAAEHRVQFGFDAAAGFEYDSNVTLQDLDASSGEADTATMLDAALNMRIAAGDNVSLRFGYDISATTYQNYSEYDLTLHHFNMGLSRRGRYADVTIAVDRFDGVLDGEDYVSYTQVSPGIARLFGSSVYLRGAYVAADKEYDETSTRNAKSKAVRVDTYWLLDGMDRYWSVGLQKSSEDATDAELDFGAALLGITYAHSFELRSMTLQLKARLRLEERDYLNVTQSIGARREDKRLRSGLSVLIPFSDQVKLEANIELTDNTSNLDTAALERTTFGLNLAVSF